jgi:hypothetical protein
MPIVLSIVLPTELPIVRPRILGRTGLVLAWGGSGVVGSGGALELRDMTVMEGGAGDQFEPNIEWHEALFTKTVTLMKVAISQQEHQELLFAALAILRVVLRARSSALFGGAGCAALASAASSSASSRRNPRAILANRLCSCAIGFAWYFVM